MRPRFRLDPPSARHLAEPLAEPGGNLAEWRERRLLRAGIPPDLAVEIAEDCAMDLHAMIELVEAGCPAELAVRILAPIDRRRDPC
jgi:hypothetical protein